MNEWISVKDRLPGEEHNCSEDVLVSIKYRNASEGEPETICCGYLCERQWFTYMDHDYHEVGLGNAKGDIVTHWMPLPEPPEEAQE